MGLSTLVVAASLLTGHFSEVEVLSPYVNMLITVVTELISDTNLCKSADFTQLI